MHTYIKQHGVQRSCTNYIKFLIEQNCVDVTVLSDLFGDKHKRQLSVYDWSKPWLKECDRVDSGFITSVRDAYCTGRFHYMVCVKDPYAWYVSFARYRGKLKYGIDKQHLVASIKQWNQMYDNWLNGKYPARNSVLFVCCYDDFLDKKTGKSLDTLCDVFSLQRNGLLVTPQNQMQRGGQHLSPNNATTDTVFDLQYYQAKQYLDFYSDKDLAIIRDNIDRQLVKQLGYQLI